MVYEGSHRLGELFKARREKGSEGLPMLSVTMNDGLVDRGSLDRKMETNLAHHEHLLVKKEDIAYNMMRMWQGASGRAEKEGLVSPAYVVLSPKKDIDSSYAAYLFKSHRLIYLFWAYSYGLTGDRLRLYFADFARIPVTVPSVGQQKKIADVLTTWDKAIAATERLARNSKAQKLALMQRLLKGKKRLPGFGGTWKSVRFNQVFERVQRKNSIGNGAVLTISGTHGLVPQREFFSKNVASDDLKNYILLHKSEFAYNKSYSNGYPYGAIKSLQRFDRGVVSSLYLCFRLKDAERHDHGFYRHYFEAGCFDREIYAIAQEGARNHGLLNVSAADFFNARLLVPEHSEQTRISDVINVAEREHANFEAQLESLRLQKQALMQQLLAGKRRVKLDSAA